MIGTYILKMSSSDYNSLQPSRKEKMTQVALQMIQGTVPKSSSSSSSSGSSPSTPRNLKRAVGLAQLTGSVMLGALNLAQATTNCVGNTLIDAMTANENESQETNQEEISSIHSSQPASVSSATSPIIITSSSDSSVHDYPVAPPTELPIPTSPPSSSSSASSSRRSRRSVNVVEND